MRPAILLLGVAATLPAANWRLNPRAAAAGPALRASLPDVHSVRSDGRYVYVESAGLALQSLGPLEAGGWDPASGVRHFVYRFPIAPRKAAGAPTRTPAGVIGAFLNGVPIYNVTSAVSWRDQDIWHLDPAASAPSSPLFESLLAANGSHSPIIGFAFDGYPIYGPYGWDDAGRVVRLRSSYRLRNLTRRDVLPGGVALGPSQEGPVVDAQRPAGTFVEDYEYAAGSGDLDEHNGRWARTPEYPDGTYAYFLSTYPYLVGPTYYGNVSARDLLNAAHADMPAPAEGPRIEGDGRVSLRASATIEACERATFAFTFRDEAGRPIRFLEKVHERPVHLIVTSDDLRYFAHIHPELRPDDSFAVDHAFPRAGDYWLFADYTAPGSGPETARFRVRVSGDKQAADDAPPPRLRVSLRAPALIRAGEDVKLRFDVSDPATGQPVFDLEPYLGSWAHIMIVSADKRRFIHAHPIDDSSLAAPEDPWKHTHAATGPSPASVETVTGFAEAGRYRAWAQFQRAGETVAIPFDLNVLPAAPKVAAPDPAPVGGDAIRIEVTRAGFAPARIAIPAGRPARLAFDRKDAENCASAVVFPELNIRRDLPAGKVTVVELPASEPREISFSCGMRMYRGVVVAR